MINKPLVLISRCARLLTASLLLPLCTYAANVDWDGGGDANTSGTWETDANWTGDAAPTAADNARLLDVTSGTREVTISDGTPQTIKQLTITQTTAGGVNVLNVNDDFTLEGTGTTYKPFAITATAGQDSIVTNIAAGKTFTVNNSTDTYTAAYAGAVHVGESGSFIITNTATVSDKFATASFGGSVTLADGAKLGVETGSEGNNKQTSLTIEGSVEIGSGATLISASAPDKPSNKDATITLNGQTTVAADGNIQASAGNVGSTGKGIVNINHDLELAGNIVVKGGGAIINLAADKTSTWTAGSTVLVQATNRGGTMQLNNAGTLSMDAATVTLDYATTDSINAGSRRFTNTGDWTLANGSNLSFISSGEKEIGNEGFNTGANNSNAGTLRVEDNSRLEFSSLFNTGLMQVGSPSNSENEKLTRLGNNVGGTNFTGFRTVVLNNGYDTGNATLEVLGDTWLGRTNSIGNTYTSLENGTDRQHKSGSGADASTGNVIRIGDGVADVTFTVANHSARVGNATDNTINLNSNATLLIKSIATGSSTGTTTLTNRGTLVQAGTLQFQGNSWGGRSFANDSDSIYRISGTTAVIEALAGNGSGFDVATLAFTSSGLVTGASSYDKLTYINSSGRSSENTLTLTITGGELTPGNGSRGVGTSSIGALEFVNTNIVLAGATKVTFDIGGLDQDNDESGDPLAFDHVLTGGRTFNIGDDTGAVLDIWLTNGFATTHAQSYLLVDASGGSVSGTFSTLLFQGEAVTDQYTVGYLSDRLVLNLAAGVGAPIPEPATSALLLGLGGFALVGFRRRRG